MSGLANSNRYGQTRMQLFGLVVMTLMAGLGLGNSEIGPCKLPNRRRGLGAHRGLAARKWRCTPKR
eukprot:806472-Lingulodinium_polyedra.AAC.1